MNILVCVKAVPDMESHFTLQSDSLHIEDSNLVYKMNSFDECAVEEALKMKEKNGGEVVIVSLGDDKTVQVMRKAFAMGADRGVFLNNASFKDTDALTVAGLLHKAVSDFKPDLILTGIQAEDDIQAQVGPALAELFGVPHASVVVSVVLSEDAKKIKVKRELEGGTLEVVEMSLPCLLTIQTGINIPRYPSLPGIMKAKKKEIKEIKLSESDLGSSKVERVTLLEPQPEGKVEILQGDAKSVATQLISKLKERKVFT